MLTSGVVGGDMDVVRTEPDAGSGMNERPRRHSLGGCGGGGESRCGMRVIMVVAMQSERRQHMRERVANASHQEIIPG